MKKLIFVVLVLLLNVGVSGADTKWTQYTKEGIRLVATDSPCTHPALVSRGYQFIVTSGIPVSRLKSPDDAYSVDAESYATTVLGCWSPIMHKAFFHRKHDGKEWEDGFKVDNTWVKSDLSATPSEVNASTSLAAVTTSSSVDPATYAERERLADKVRQQKIEDEDRALEHRNELLDIKLKEAQLRGAEQAGSAELKVAEALADAKAKRANELLDAELKKDLSKTDVIQSDADVNRTFAKGSSNYLTGLGFSDLYKFLVIVSLIILVILLTVIAWFIYKKNTQIGLPPKQEHLIISKG